MKKGLALICALMLTTSVFAKEAKTRSKTAVALYQHGVACSDIAEHVFIKRLKFSNKVGTWVTAGTIVGGVLVLGPLSLAGVIPGAYLAANVGLEFGGMTLLTGAGMLRTGKKTPYTGFLNKRLAYQIEVMKYETEVYDAEKFMELTGWDFQYDDEREYVKKKLQGYYNKKHLINKMIDAAPSTVFSKEQSIDIVVAKLKQMDAGQELCRLEGKHVYFDSKKELQAKVNEMLK